MRTTTVISTITLAAAVLAGCSDEPVPKEPGRTASPTTPANTETPPPMPEQATQNSAEGAAAFLDHYLDVMNYASHTGDVAPLEELSLDTCGACDTFVAAVADVYGNGGRFEGGEWSIADVRLAPLGPEVSASGEVTLAAGRQWRDSASDPEQTAGETTPVEFRLVYTDAAWRMASYAGTTA